MLPLKINDMSAIKLDGQLNVSVIQREVAKDIARDKQYQVEDGMKKRAIHISKNYDEFKNFVACSNLQPVQRHEMNQLFISTETQHAMNRNRPNKVFNSSSEMDQTSKKLLEGLRITSTSNSTSATEQSSSQVCTRTSCDLSSKVPETLMEFEKEWRYFCTSVDATLQYILLPLGSTNYVYDKGNFFVPIKLRLCPDYVCCKLCKVEMNSGIFGELLQALRYLLEVSEGYRVDHSIVEEVLCSEDANIQNSHLFVFQWMKYLRLSGGFELNIAFVNSHEKNAIRAIFEIMNKRLFKRARGEDFQEDHTVSDSTRFSSDDDKCLSGLARAYKVN